MKRILPFILIGLLGVVSSVVASWILRGRLVAGIPASLAPLAEARRASSTPPPPPDLLGEEASLEIKNAAGQMELSLKALDEMRETSEPGSLRFDNPDVINLIQQYRGKIQYLKDREFRLKELDDRIRVEQQSLSVSTQWLYRVQGIQMALLTNRMAYIRTEEQRALEEHARRLQALPVAQAVALLTNSPPDEIARTLSVLGSSNAAPLLGGILASGESGLRLASDVSKRMMKFSTRNPDGTNTPVIPPPPR